MSTIVLNMSTIVLNMSTDVPNVLFGKSRQTLLSLFLIRSHDTFYLRQIQRLTGISIGTLQREVNQLVQAGIITRISKDRRISYKANDKNPIFSELKSIIIKTVGLGDILRNALAPFADRIRAAFIYGSFAGGNPTEDSDVDVLIVGSIPFGQVIDIFQEAQETIGREINPTVYPVEEFRKKTKEKKHFPGSILEGPAIFLIGDHEDLKKLAG